MNGYETPGWSQKILWAIILGGVLSLVAAIAHAKEFTMTCDAFQSNDRVRCEFKGLTEFRVHWKLSINGRVTQHEVGPVVYLTLDNQWRTLRVFVITELTEVTVFDGFVRWNGKNAVFGRRE